MTSAADRHRMNAMNPRKLRPLLSLRLRRDSLPTDRLWMIVRLTSQEVLNAFPLRRL